MPKFKFVGYVETVFPTIQRNDGSTLVLKPGETVTLRKDPESVWLQPVAEEKPQESQAAKESKK